MQSKKQAQQFLQNKVNPIFQQILVDLVKSKPKNILNFCKVWFEKKIQIQMQTQKNITIESDTDSDEQSFTDTTIQEKKLKQRWLKPRKAICGEVYGLHNKIEQTQIQSISKKTSVNNRILFRLKSLFLFKDFDDQDTNKLISAMSQVTYQEDTVIIEQGDQGNEIYIVDQGQLHCYRNADGQQVYIKTITEGEMFGEISMLYNTKRSANIRSKTKAICFILDRKTFNTVVRQKNIRKRKTVMEIMNKVDIFKQLESDERFQIQDIIKQMPVHLNQYIMRQGKMNNKLFMIEHGKLVSLKKQKNGHQKILSNFKDGDFFGLDSLINKKNSTVSVMALTTSKLYYIECQAIQRVVGPIDKILHRNVQIYEKYKLK